MNIGKLVKPNVRTLQAYQAEDIPCSVKLDANESPYGFTVLKSVKTNTYPDPEAKELRKLMARQLRVKAGCILHGNGSDELISCLITAFGGPVLYPTPTFSMYGIIAQALGEKKVEVRLDSSFDIDMENFLKAVQKHEPKLIFLSSPNNPTGNCFSEERIRKVIAKAPGLVIVDEAYHAFSDRKSFIPLLKKHNNLLVLRTLSKIGLASLRTGFLIADSEVIREVNKVRLPFNVNSLSQRVAVDALRNQERIRATVSRVCSERKRLFTAMKQMNGLTVYPSDANFIFFSAGRGDRVHRLLLKQGILIRDMSGVAEGFLRVTVGTPRENNAFLRALSRIL